MQTCEYILMSFTYIPPDWQAPSKSSRLCARDTYVRVEIYRHMLAEICNVFDMRTCSLTGTQQICSAMRASRGNCTACICWDMSSSENIPVWIHVTWLIHMCAPRGNCTGCIFWDISSSEIIPVETHVCDMTWLIHMCEWVSIWSHSHRMWTSKYEFFREVGGWGRDPKKCTGRDWGMGSSTI